MEVDKLMTDAMKREARKAIKDWALSELRDLVADEADKIAKEWIRSNRKIVEEGVHAEIQKRVKSLSREVSLRISDSIRYM